MYEGKVSEPYSKTVLESIYEEGEKRYQKKFPPGYEDEKTKKDRTKEYDDVIYKDKFGDLVVWKQIIDKAKEDQKTIVFVTDDVKEDWWEIQKGRTIGPRIELLNEFKKEANVDFYMYKTDSFMSYIKEFLQEQVNTDVIKEMEDLRENNLQNEDIYLNNYITPAEFIKSYNKSLEPDEYIRTYNDSNELAYLGDYNDLNERIYPDGSIEVQRELAKEDNFEYIKQKRNYENREYFTENIQILRSKIDRISKEFNSTFEGLDIYKYQQLRTDYFRSILKFNGEKSSLNELQAQYLYLKKIYIELKEIYTDSILKSKKLV